MNLGHLWICLVGIAPSNNLGAKKGNITLYGRGFPLHCLIWSLGNPTGHGIQFQGMGILFNYHCHRSELIQQSFHSLDLSEQLPFH